MSAIIVGAIVMSKPSSMQGERVFAGLWMGVAGVAVVAWAGMVLG